MAENKKGVGPIVSSAQLAAQGSAELSEFEVGLIIANNAFARGTVRCMAAAGVPDLSPLDVLVLHSISHRDRSKKMADICFVLNVEDTHTVNYSLKKLVKLGLVAGEKRGKEKFFSTTDEGQKACEQYAEVRSECLLNSLNALGCTEEDVHSTARLLRALSGLYDQAARAATSL